MARLNRKRHLDPPQIADMAGMELVGPGKKLRGRDVVVAKDFATGKPSPDPCEITSHTEMIDDGPISGQPIQVSL
jgi:hypothetical protein